jgi:hypothetical protein
MTTMPISTRDFAAIRAEVARIRAAADHAVEQAILRIDAQRPELATTSNRRQRLIATATRPHRVHEDAALTEVTRDLSERERAELFTLTLDPHFAPRH